MNMKYYLRGLGIGLIVTTLILTISHHVSTPQAGEKETQAQPTTGSVIAYTKEDKTNEESITKQDTEPANQDTEPTNQQTEPTSSIPEEEPTQQNEDEDENTIITINIQGVYYGSDVADLLYDADVITDKQEFSDYLKDNGYDTIIREGSYTFHKGDTYENLAKIITRLD